MSTAIPSNTDARGNERAKVRGGATEEDRSKGVDSAEPSNETRTRGGVTEEDRSKSLGTNDPLDR
jgi:hypothetical protein